MSQDFTDLEKTLLKAILGERSYSKKVLAYMSDNELVNTNNVPSILTQIRQSFNGLINNEIFKNSIIETAKKEARYHRNLVEKIKKLLAI